VALAGGFRRVLAFGGPTRLEEAPCIAGRVRDIEQHRAVEDQRLIFPTMKPLGTGPQNRLSSDCPRLSPSMK
jgi:hypothetical protein